MQTVLIIAVIVLFASVVSLAVLLWHVRRVFRTEIEWRRHDAVDLRTRVRDLENQRQEWRSETAVARAKITVAEASIQAVLNALENDHGNDEFLTEMRDEFVQRLDAEIEQREKEWGDQIEKLTTERAMATSDEQIDLPRTVDAYDKLLEETTFLWTTEKLWLRESRARMLNHLPDSNVVTFSKD